MINKKGQIFIQIIIAFFIWIIGILALPLLIDILTGTRTTLSCATPSAISDGTKFLCLITDAGVPILIWTLVSVVIGIIIGRGR